MATTADPPSHFVVLFWFWAIGHLHNGFLAKERVNNAQCTTPHNSVYYSISIKKVKPLKWFTLEARSARILPYFVLFVTPSGGFDGPRGGFAGFPPEMKLNASP